MRETSHKCMLQSAAPPSGASGVNAGAVRRVGLCGASGTTPACGGEYLRVRVTGVRVGGPWGVPQGGWQPPAAANLAIAQQ